SGARTFPVPGARSDPGSRSRLGGWDGANLPEQAERVPVDPLFNELAIDNTAEELSIHIDRLASGSGTFQLPAVSTAQGPVGFDHISFRDLTFDPQIEVVDNAAITTHSLLESLWTRPLVRVVRVMILIILRVQLI